MGVFGHTFFDFTSEHVAKNRLDPCFFESTLYTPYKSLAVHSGAYISGWWGRAALAAPYCPLPLRPVGPIRSTVSAIHSH